MGWLFQLYDLKRQHIYVRPSNNVDNVCLYFPCVSDDGKLSFEEFNAYFADGILTTEELQELFYSIDGRQNKWVFYLKRALILIACGIINV